MPALDSLVILHPINNATCLGHPAFSPHGGFGEVFVEMLHDGRDLKYLLMAPDRSSVDGK